MVALTVFEVTVWQLGQTSHYDQGPQLVFVPDYQEGLHASMTIHPPVPPQLGDKVGAVQTDRLNQCLCLVWHWGAGDAGTNPRCDHHDGEHDVNIPGQHSFRASPCPTMHHDLSHP